SPSTFPPTRFATRIATATKAPMPVATQMPRPTRTARSESRTQAVQSSGITGFCSSAAESTSCGDGGVSLAAPGVRAGRHVRGAVAGLLLLRLEVLSPARDLDGPRVLGVGEGHPDRPELHAGRGLPPHPSDGGGRVRTDDGAARADARHRPPRLDPGG